MLHSEWSSFPFVLCFTILTHLHSSTGLFFNCILALFIAIVFCFLGGGYFVSIEGIFLFSSWMEFYALFSKFSHKYFQALLFLDGWNNGWFIFFPFIFYFVFWFKKKRKRKGKKFFYWQTCRSYSKTLIFIKLFVFAFFIEYSTAITFFKNPK